MRGGREALPPPAVRRALEQLLGTDVAHVKVIEHSWYAWVHRAVATTRPRRIYLRGSAAEFFANPWLMLHEYCHVIRQWQCGRLTTWGYLIECLRRGYWNNHFEVEAREFADENIAGFRALLAVAPPTPRPNLLQPNSASRR
jgi:hypothetical protein